VPNALEASFVARNVSGQCCLHRFPEQRLTDELASRRVNFTRPHRFPGQLKHRRHGLEHRAHLGRSRTWFTRIGLGFA
jgi:hypothetical protein